MRLIDADVLKKHVEVAVKESGFYSPMYKSFLKAIENAPTVDYGGTTGRCSMNNPCENCKKKGRCPDVCYPKRDYERGQRKRERGRGK